MTTEQLMREFVELYVPEADREHARVSLEVLTRLAYNRGGIDQVRQIMGIGPEEAAS